MTTMDSITIDDFSKIQIRIGTVLSAEKAEGTDKLLKLIFDFGNEQRQIMSAIAQDYPDPSVLVGKQIAACVNLEPRTFRGYESQGMILATETEDGQITLLVPEKRVKAGAKVH